MMNRKTFIVLVHVIVIAQPHNQMSPNLILVRVSYQVHIILLKTF